jgi:hypothetical protein
VALICLLILRGRLFLPSLLLLLLLLMLGLTSCQALSVEPRAAALKRQIVSFETTPKEDPLRTAFARLHGISMACNPGVLLGGGRPDPLYPLHPCKYGFLCASASLREIGVGRENRWSQPWPCSA